MRILVRDLLQRRVRDAGDAAGREGQNPVIHGLQQEAVQVDEVAGNVEGRYLPPSVGDDLVAGGKPVQEQGALGRAFALPHDILVGLDHPNPRNRVFQRPLLLVGEPVLLFELQDQRVGHTGHC
jgi:hypothetical protein